MNFTRLLKHLFVPDVVARQPFSRPVLKKIEEAIKASEAQHNGEIRFVAEASLPIVYLLKRRSSRRRAEDLFAQLKVWDTEHNAGVLIYVQLVSRHIDIVADRGIARKVRQDDWSAVCRKMEAAFGRGEFLAGSVQGIERITELLHQSFPKTPGGANELPDKPVLL